MADRLAQALKSSVALACLVVLAACKHPLAIEGEGDIVELNWGVRGCTLEEFQAEAERCTDNSVLAGSYNARYAAIPRPGWKFEGWRGLACDADSTLGECHYWVSTEVLQKFNARWPDTVMPPTVAVFRRLAEPDTPLADLSFADAALGQCVAEEAERNGWAVVRDVTELLCADRSIESVEGLGAFHYAPIAKLDLSSNFIVDLTPVSALRTLESVNLRTNLISDIDALRVLNNLIDLDLAGNVIGNIQALSELKNLETLSLRSGFGHSYTDVPGHLFEELNWCYYNWEGHPCFNQFSNLSPLVELKKLKSLEAPNCFGGSSYCQYSGLEDLTSLEVLYLRGMDLDLSRLRSLRKLRILSLVGINTDDLTPLTMLTGLEELTLSSVSPIYDYCFDEKGYSYICEPLRDTDFSVLPELYNLTKLRLSYNSELDTAVLENLTQLSSLEITSSSLDDVSWVAALRNLLSLSLSRNNIRELGPLAGLAQLESLDLSHNKVVDVSVLFALVSLTELDLQGNEGIPCEQLSMLDEVLDLAMLGPEECVN